MACLKCSGFFYDRITTDGLRYGPGLVVYWHGCLKELATHYAYIGSNSNSSFAGGGGTAIDRSSTFSGGHDSLNTADSSGGSQDHNIHEDISRILSAADCASIRIIDGYVHELCRHTTMLIEVVR
jgi:hypothetical protein